MSVSSPVTVCCVCADENVSLLEELEDHLSLLQHEMLITIWYRHQIMAGMDSSQAFDTYLQKASIILDDE